MKSKQKFFKCKFCGNMVGLINDKGKPLMCCGEKMEEIAANSTEASTEKHLPAVAVSGDSVSVQVGSAAHPMEADHYITFVFLETESGGQRKSLSVGAEPKVKFGLCDDKPVAVYAYCNKHGLWKTEI